MASKVKSMLAAETAPVALPMENTPLFIVAVGRGGKGKTTLLKYILEQAMMQGHPCLIGDADRTNRTLSRFFGNVSSPESSDDRDVRYWLEGVIDRVIETRTTVVLDFGGGDVTFRQVARELELSALLTEHDLKPVALHLLGPDSDDLAPLADLEHEAVFAPAATALILNEALVPAHRSAAVAFRETIHLNPILTRVVERGAEIMTIPRLVPADQIDRRRIGFHAAANGQTAQGLPPLGPTARQQTKIWLRDMSQTLAPIQAWLP